MSPDNLSRFLDYSRYGHRGKLNDEEADGVLFIENPEEHPQLSEEILRDARLAGIADEHTTLQQFYESLRQEGFNETALGAKLFSPMIVRRRK